jgi:ribosomal protein S18 acetylase RimI-like enzyme
MIATVAIESDLDWLIQHDNHLSSHLIQQKIARQEYLIARKGDQCVGLLRFTPFWSQIPYIDLIWVAESYRRQGAGKALLTQLEAIARAQNQPIIMSSSQADESHPQAWHRHMGFRDAGALVDLRPFQSVTEIIFIKPL